MHIYRYRNTYYTHIEIKEYILYTYTYTGIHRYTHIWGKPFTTW